MKRVVLAVALIALIGCSATRGQSGGAPFLQPGQPPALGLPRGPLHPIRLCPTLPSGIHCDAMAMAGPDGKTAAPQPKPVGLSPQDLWAAYGLTPYTATGGANQTIGIVAIFDTPTVESDLAVYRSTFGLPPCTKANGCLRIVDELGLPETAIPTASGQTGLTGEDLTRTGGELNLDVDMVSAACPRCHILIVEAYTEGAPGVPILDITNKDVAIAANTAARLGAQVVSSSLGGLDGLDPSQAADDALYNTPGTVQLASTGDGGYGTEYPAASTHVIAVGGTSLRKNPLVPRGWSETAWNLAGSGCSTVEAKPPWQRDPLCPNRMVGDVSADADPATGVATYDTFDLTGGLGGWMITGGTSASSPFIAGVIGLAGNGATMGSGAGYLYAHPNGFRDIQGGFNKHGCGDYTCRGDIGFDGPTGLGVPNGISGL